MSAFFRSHPHVFRQLNASPGLDPVFDTNSATSCVSIAVDFRYPFVLAASLMFNAVSVVYEAEEKISIKFVFCLLSYLVRANEIDDQFIGDGGVQETKKKYNFNLDEAMLASLRRLFGNACVALAPERRFLFSEGTIPFEFYK